MFKIGKIEKRGNIGVCVDGIHKNLDNVDDFSEADIGLEILVLVDDNFCSGIRPENIESVKFNMVFSLPMRGLRIQKEDEARGAGDDR